MTRRIVVARPSAGVGRVPDTYFDRVVKYIPADIVAAWVAVSGLIAGAADVPKARLLWISFAAAVVLTYLWTRKQTSAAGQPPAHLQSLIATGAFVVWVFALGGPFATLGFYHPVYGSLVLIFYTLVVGLIVPER